MNNKESSQWATKMLSHLVVKLDFSASWSHFPPFPQNNVDFSISLTAQTTSRPQRQHNIELGGGGITELKLDVNKIEQLLKYRKASFSESVSTFFVAHC